jgi:dolichol-phosphate hexosyltransferase
VPARPTDQWLHDRHSSLTILMPVYNEAATVEAAIEQVLATPLPIERTELIVIDDGSTDGTGRLLDNLQMPNGVVLLRHRTNSGKGAAIRTGLQRATGEFTAIIDADLEYDPADIALLLPRLLSGESAAVFGTRGFQSHSAYSFWYVVGNKAVTLAASALYNGWVSDIMTCHKAIRTDLFRSLRLREKGFAIEPEITARLLLSGERIYEVPITYQARQREEGKKLTTLDGVRVMVTLLRCRLR